VRQCDRAAALQLIRESDRGRRSFVKQYFNQDLGDVHLYDFVINRAQMSVEEIAQLIADQVRRRFAQT
jgi:cytidylate kinase